ncbi:MULTISPECIES: YgiW/YdeI family stress tolerance OB fold protein [Lelliottia]|uniref:YgiW/YdeI family stress tolerance OB fold protein n=1 Tax=Lelliottia wanjuensis TaxID=3050585 RepID=A0AAP4D3D4_9ENTR|nr:MULTISPECIES: NirD/YgiW/YdeI family stress tolerance protein [unclassified Lelliottia]MDI3361823.1 YgiW/YdeI family stress tolerance OB fold protein [Lelliottia sp. V89_13]MDK9354952.1 YgiW/YdeI family stress tolerance OB fold protein [Lelliottia sp. V106_16]MDK9362740.1 YgiW/YdeI family stress tolerance OB fold protein [Lelliottia sp. V106_12]MDK9372160.1 YgiW/YdeI family stress tolerance OB fold protein [Lelliottia sp. V106_10]MDK9550718.1 YgiW/YdeI family stress tolerance OB fold protein
MKKFAAITAIMMMTTAPVFAAEGGFNGPSATPAQTQTQQGGFVDNDANLTTAAKVKDQKDDSWVKLRGNITERLSDDRYLFRDTTGTVNVEIDHKRWNGQTISPQDKVEIQGKVDKEWNEFEIDVKQVIKLSK